MQQNEKNNIEVEIDNKIIIIYGKMRNWKTLLAGLIAYYDFQKRIYSNFQIYKGWKSVLNKYIETFQDVKNVRFSYTPGVICLDEWGINANSKDGFKESSRILHEALFYSWKVNCSILITAQRKNSIDINFRELADLIIECKKVWREKDGRPIFLVTRYQAKWDQLIFHSDYILDSIKFMRFMGITYDTLETSKMTNESEKKQLEDLSTFEVEDRS